MKISDIISRIFKDRYRYRFSHELLLNLREIIYFLGSFILLFFSNTMYRYPYIYIGKIYFFSTTITQYGGHSFDGILVNRNRRSYARTHIIIIYASYRAAYDGDEHDCGSGLRGEVESSMHRPPQSPPSFPPSTSPP